MSWLKRKYNDYSDEVLMYHLGKGDKQAFDELYLRYARPMKAYFFRLLWKDKEKAEDFVHDLFAKIITRPDAFDINRSFKTWFYSVANNMVKNEYKKQSIRGTADQAPHDDRRLSDALNPDENAHLQNFSQELEEVLQSMDEKHRIVFELRHHDGLSIKEIAEVLNEKDGTIKSRLFYATKQLAERLRAYAPEVHT